jgi:Carbohydrate family 9 binding domain-like
MSQRVRSTAALLAGWLCAVGPSPLDAQRAVVAPEGTPFAPRRYVVYRASDVKVDGKLDDPSWSSAPWTDTFVDIEGALRPAPQFRTRAKMLWDDDYFYVAAEMEDPDVWATLTERDSVIFRDNDFEVFIDPDGDTHAYYELEMNALGTVWDLILIKPYRDGGPAINGWDIAGLQAAVDVRGTLNRPGDKDDGWTVEIAMPWRVLREAAGGRKPPQPGDRWRVNFSRVQWQVDITEGGTSSGSNQGARIRCRRATGSGVPRVRSTCTCPNSGAMSSSHVCKPVGQRKGSWKTRTSE